MICDSSSVSTNAEEMRSSIKARLAPCGENAGTSKKQIKGETNKQTNKKDNRLDEWVGRRKWKEIEAE